MKQEWSLPADGEGGARIKKPRRLCRRHRRAGVLRPGRDADAFLPLSGCPARGIGQPRWRLRHRAANRGRSAVGSAGTRRAAPGRSSAHRRWSPIVLRDCGTSLIGILAVLNTGGLIPHEKVSCGRCNFCARRLSHACISPEALVRVSRIARKRAQGRLAGPPKSHTAATGFRPATLRSPGLGICDDPWWEEGGFRWRFSPQTNQSP